MSLTGMWEVGTEAGRPAFGVVSRLYFATDTGRVFRDTGSAWEPTTLVHRGAWSGATTYQLHDLVTSAGSVWRALRSNTNVTPVEGADWTLFVSKGDVGPSAPDASATVKGIAKLSTAPVSATDPIAVGDNDSRMTNARTPTAHKTSHEPGGGDALTGLTDASIAAANKDGAAGTASMRTLGTGAQQAAPGNDSRFTTAASETVAGHVEFATSAETITGTSTVLGTTPAGVKAAIDARFQYETIAFSFKGTLTTTTDTGALRVPIINTGTIVKAYAKIETAPTGASLIIDLNKNGTSIWATTQANRLTVAISGTSATQTTFDTTAVTEDDYITCNLDQVGSTVAGANLVVVLKYRYAI